MKCNIPGMQMSWWGWDKDDDKNDDSDNGVKIDWAAYNDLNNNDNNSNNNNTPEDRGVIEVPAASESVIYQDEDGNYYEVDIGELEDYDEDGEIEYSKTSSKPRQVTAMHQKAKNISKTIMQIYNSQIRYSAFRSYVR